MLAWQSPRRHTGRPPDSAASPLVPASGCDAREMNGHGQDSALGQAGKPVKATTHAIARRRGSGSAAGGWHRNGLASGSLDPGGGVLRTRHLGHLAGPRADGFRPNRKPAQARRHSGDRQAHLHTCDRPPGLAGGAGAQASGCPCFLRPTTSYSNVRRGRGLVDPVPPRAVTTGLAVPKPRPPPGVAGDRNQWIR